MSSITHTIRIPANRKKVYEALITGTALKHWHSAHTILETERDELNTGDVVRFTFKDKPDFRWRVSELKTNEVVTWLCEEGHGDAAGKSVSFTLSDAGDHKTLVSLAQEGFESDVAVQRQCNTLWGILLGQLKHYVENGEAAMVLG